MKKTLLGYNAVETDKRSQDVLEYRGRIMQSCSLLTSALEEI